ncbi:hypothetical protein O181_092694 [Austropuccinia psidii MF-1]|uniref:Uncharacterized protein n=1 Tax=Austropuccinia psidii MF-1 TaxID=1389203 RepID=A0A9Q3P954_9BASI|nr:hypothetical protein [Austropuccinia psidii MF-1]
MPSIQPSPKLILAHPCFLPFSHSHHALKICLQGLPQSPQDMPPTPPPLVCFHTPATYHADSPTEPSRYGSNTSTPSLPSPLLMLPHPCLIPSAAYHAHGVHVEPTHRNFHNNGNSHIHAISNLLKFSHFHNHWPDWPFLLFWPFMVISQSGPNLVPSSSGVPWPDFAFGKAFVFSSQQGKYSPNMCIFLFNL